jgi:hypothetical protein
MSTGQVDGRVGVAISTTGQEHRLGFLETAARHWWTALAPLGLPTTVFVTVDGSVEEFEQVMERVCGFAEVIRVGQPDVAGSTLLREVNRRQGVAVNKNTGIEALMGRDVEHLFLSDDDTYPKFSQSITKHIDMGYPHSLVCWGKSRIDTLVTNPNYAAWTWPRGVMMYAHRSVVERVGGMDERFGAPGGHEHAEWSQRIHNAGLTPTPFGSPYSYVTRGGQGAAALWHAEDMPQPGEAHGSLGSRRRAITTMRRQPGDWTRINRIMEERKGSDAFVAYTAAENGRSSATLYPSRAEEPKD